MIYAKSETRVSGGGKFVATDGTTGSDEISAQHSSLFADSPGGGAKAKVGDMVSTAEEGNWERLGIGRRWGEGGGVGRIPDWLENKGVEALLCGVKTATVQFS